MKRLLSIVILFFGCSVLPTEPKDDISLTGWWLAESGEKFKFYMSLEHFNKEIEGFGWVENDFYAVYFKINGEYERPKLYIQCYPASFSSFFGYGWYASDSLKMTFVGLGVSKLPLTFYRLEDKPL